MSHEEIMKELNEFEMLRMVGFENGAYGEDLLTSLLTKVRTYLDENEKKSLSEMKTTVLATKYIPGKGIGILSKIHI
jgi:hypothetical protein